MPDFSPELENFITELDAAVEAHMSWTRRVMRCAVLHTSPGEDVLSPSAHTLCRFGRWFMSKQSDFEKMSLQNTQRLIAVHQSMHDAIRSICANVLAGRPAQSAHLDVFEQTQAELIELLAEFKTQFLATAVRHDPLTGLPLRYGLEQEFIQLQKLCRRNKLLLYVVMIDVDHFKLVNDNYGHSVGDIALRHLVDTIKRNIRPGEPLYRFGGEEFLLLMQTQSPEEAASAAKRLINVVRDAPVLIPQNKPLAMTITIGLSLAGQDEKLDSVIERADRALFEGKRAGRDRYVIASD
ncbi:MAG: diguanylate cyclase [Gallionellales bacterium RIFCSPHIGHO2_02_FULL_57_16]|nr:MAG: diguanylate cyclase [Gallionellales bacterium RIFCSPHIGHO2_02_FULL_57_16]